MAKEKLKALSIGGAEREVIIPARVAAIGIKTESSRAATARVASSIATDLEIPSAYQARIPKCGVLATGQ
jgi:hypothetical protein